MEDRHRFDRSWAEDLRLNDGTSVWWRAVARTDRAQFELNFPRLSAEARQSRFGVALKSLPPKLSAQLVDDVDLHRHIALVLHAGAETIGVVRIVRDPDDWRTVDLAVTVADAWQGKGVSTLLARELLGLVDDVDQIVTTVLFDNTAALRLLQRLGPVTKEFIGGAWRVRVDLARGAVA